MKYLKKYYIFEDINSGHQIINGKEFKNKYCDRRGKKLWKGYFRYDSEEDMDLYSVSDIKQYGDGGYFCTTMNCEFHYEDNIGFYDFSEFILPDDILISVGSSDIFYQKEEEIRGSADGFYDPEYDTFGLVIWNRIPTY